jgi:hypothetical protein
MPYSLKITRNTYTQEIKVHSITKAPDGAKPYKHWLSGHYVESLQIFDDRAEADLARTHELLAADFARMDRETLYETFRKDLDRVAFFGWTMTTLCRKAHINYLTLFTYAYKTRKVNPRIGAKVHIVANTLENVAKTLPAILPFDAGVGSPLEARGYHADPNRIPPLW